MHKKYHKSHRHKDGSHKRSSRNKHHHKHHKKEQILSQNVLEPIQEVSKEKVKYDKQACGDYIDLVRTPLNAKEEKHKHRGRREKSMIDANGENVDQLKIDIFAKNYLQKITECSKDQLVRHHSLEQSGDSLLDRTKRLFKREKSFNDAVSKASKDSEGIRDNRKERKRRHHSETKNLEGTKEKKEQRHKHKDTSNKGSKEDSKGERRKHKKEKRAQSANSANEKSKCARVQEVVYCQLDQAPYKLKNVKNEDEITDIYQRTKREKRDKEGKKSKERSTHGEGKMEYDVGKDMGSQSHYTPQREDEKINRRSKSRRKDVDEEIIYEKERKTRRSDNSQSKDRKHENHNDNRHSIYGHFSKQVDSKILINGKQNTTNCSNIDLGPYKKYFAFEENDINKPCCKKHHTTDKERNKISKEKKHREEKEMLVLNMEYSDNKNSQEKSEGKKTTRKESKVKTDEDKIHEIIESDLKTYLSRIQHMLDEKLEAFLQISKSKHKKSSCENLKEKIKKRIRSKSNGKKSEKEKHSKIEEGCKKRDKSKHKKEKSEVKTTEKEEIIQEVLKRIKKEAAHQLQHMCDGRESIYKIKTEKEVCGKHRDMSKDAKKYSKKSLKLKEQSTHTLESSANTLGNNFRVTSSPDKIYEPNNSKDNKIHKSSDRKRCSPPPELVLSVANTSYADWVIKPRSHRKEEDLLRCASKKHNESATNCVNYSKNKPVTPMGLEVVKRSSENALKHRRDYKYAASDQLHRERCLVDYKRRSSSPERYNKAPGDEIIVARAEDSQKNKIIKHDNQLYQVFPKNVDDSERDIDHRYQESINHPIKRRSRHSLGNRNKVNLTNIIMPPDGFRTQASELNHQTFYRNPLPSPERQHGRQEFLVQGIEPPILECSNRKTVKQSRVRNMECKTVSIVGIPPQIRIPEVSMVGHMQTGNKSISPDQDLVEKRKQSKRFKLYYKYSLVNHHQEDKESAFSDVRSIISDSFRVFSDPSEIESENVRYDSSFRTEREKQLALEVSQVQNLVIKKWNRGDTPRDAHLRNIMEEPSCVSTSTKHGEYFIPIRGNNECYFRPLLSSHSDCCFKVNKKPASSNISILSRETCDGKYVYSQDARSRYIKRAKKSKSDFKIMPFSDDIHFLRSKSDVFLQENKGKQIIKSIFQDDTHSHVKSIRVGPSPNNEVRDTNNIKRVCKECQTSELNVNYENIIAEEEKRKLAYEDKQRQFKDIYKTIDNLEENIHINRKALPNTCDVAISSTFLYLGRNSDQTQHFKINHNATDTIEDKIIRSSYRTADKTVDAAIGSPMKINRSNKTESKKNTHDIAIGISKEQMEKREKSRDFRSESMGYHLKSTGVSPIRIVENIEHKGRSPIRKSITPMSPTPRLRVERVSTARRSSAKPDDSPLRKPVQKSTDSKKGPTAPNIHKPKTSLAQDRKVKSPERPLEKKDQKNQLKTTAVAPHVAPPVKVFRSDEKSANMKKRQNTIESRKEDRKSEEKTPKPNESQKTAVEPKGPCILVHVSEDSRHIITVSKKVPQSSSRTSFRKEISEEKKDVYVKPTSCNHQDNIHKSCVHHYHPKDINARKSSKHDTKLKTPNTRSGKSVTVNTALFKCNPSFHKKVIMVERSTSSSVSGGIFPMRKSKSLVEMRSHKTSMKKSKSEIINVENALLFCKPSGTGINDGSVVSGNMEKFTNVPRLRCQSSKSNVNSLDQYMGGKLPSRLFLTKDYKGAEISAYQKRKLYDQSIRQKMKRKFRFSKLNVGPQIFEVHFVSMVNSEKEKAAKEQNRFKRPIISLNLEEINGKNAKDKNKNEDNQIEKENSLVYDNKPKTRDVNFDTNKRSKNDVGIEDNFIDTNKNHPIVYIPNQKHENIVSPNEYVVKKPNAKDKDNTVTELYFKDENMYQDKLLSFCNKLLEVNSSLELQEELKGAQCGCSKYSEDCQSCKNFVNLMGVLCSSIASYCDSKNNLVNLKLGVNSDLKEFLNNYSNTDGSHELHIYSPNLELVDVSNNVQEIYSRNGNNTLDDSNDSSNQSDKIFKNLVDCQSFSTNRTEEAQQLPLPLSCPVLATNASSFEFLYEESSSGREGVSCEKVLANLTQPCGQTFNFSMSQYNVETPFFQRNSYFSATGSSESGYASIKSKSYKGNSLTSFFKKPNIAALFKPPPKDDVEICNIYEPGTIDNFKKSVLYKEMTKNCQLYAKKVRENSNMKLSEKSNDYQEFSLSILMGQDSSILLQSKMVSRQTSGHAIEILSGNSEFTTHKGETIKTNINKETSGCPSQESTNILKTSESFFAEKGCKLVLSNECLKINSVTYLGANIFNEDCLKPKQNISKELEQNVGEHYNNKKDKDDEASLALDFLLESTNPFVPNKDSATQKFFESLIKVYEKEVSICSELFRNDEFLKNVLLPAVEERKYQLKKNRIRKFSGLFRKKTQVNLSTSNESKYQDKKSNLDSEISVKLQNLAFNARKYFAMLADAVKVNENIDDELKICGLLKLLERIECGDFFMIENDESNFKENIKTQIKEAFVNVYEICQKEAKKAKKRIGDKEIYLIKLFVGKYKIGLLSKTDIVASYIGRGVIKTEQQLKAAVTYLIHSQSKEVNVRKFEEYCNFTTTIKK